MSDIPWEKRRYRDRHGRGARRPPFGLRLPHYRTAAGTFDALFAAQLRRLSRGWPDLIASTQFAVEDVPPSDPLPWEERIAPLSASYPAEHGQAARIVLYRLPIQMAAHSRWELEFVMHDEIVRQLAQLTGRNPEDIDLR